MSYVGEPGRRIVLDGPQSSRRTVLHGKFRAQDDLLLVKWSDASLLNLRWRLSGEALLLTDHDGQLSRLLPIAESHRDSIVAPR